MPWKQVSADAYERPLDSLERLWVDSGAAGSQAGEENFALSVLTQIEFDTLPQEAAERALRHAWKTMRYEFPRIASFVDGDKLRYEIASDNAAAESWLAETFIVVSSMDADDMFPRLKSPSPGAVLYYFPRRLEVVLNASHWLIDGIGSLLLLDRFLEYTASPRDDSTLAWGTEAKNLTPSFDEVLSISSKMTLQEAEAASDKLLTDFAMHLPTISLPTTPSPKPNSTTHRQELCLSAEETSSIVSACKARNLTVTAACHAALTAATQALSTADTVAQNYAAWAVFNLRKYCPVPYNRSVFAVAVAFTGIPFAFNPGTFVTNAAVLNSYYKDVFANPSATMPIIGPLNTKMMQIFTAPSTSGKPSQSAPGLSSIGITNRHLRDSYGDGKLKVTRFWLGGALMNTQIWVHLWTWNGRLTFSSIFNDGVYARETVHHFLDKITNVLRKELLSQTD